MLVENEAYFDGLDESFYKRGDEMLKKCWVDCAPIQESCIHG